MTLREQPVAIAYAQSPTTHDWWGDPEIALSSVIGVAGSGKSTFVHLASSGSNMLASTSLGSSTAALTSSTFSLDGRTVTLIDTPGFDDTTQNVLDVLKLISDSFFGLRSQGVKLAGVIYMHRVAEDRLGGPSRHNFNVFRKFCGDTSLRDVLIVVNKGPPGKEPNGDEAREHEFSPKDECFRPALDKGARMLLHDGSQASAHTILRHMINRELTLPPAQGDSFHQRTKMTHTATDADVVRELTGQVGRYAKEFKELHEGISASTRAEDTETRETLQEKAKSSLEKIERIRYDLEKMVTNFATENSRLEDENRRYKEDFSAQNAEAEVNTRLLGEERRARELAETERGRVETQLTKERALWERQKVERESLRNHAGPKYDKLFVCGALVFALICVSRLLYDGSILLQ